MALKLHRCSITWLKVAHPCWTVEKALQEQGIEYETVTMLGLPRSKRTAVVDGTGQKYFPAIEFEDGSWYREQSKDMAATISAGKLDSKRGSAAPASG